MDIGDKLISKVSKNFFEDYDDQIDVLIYKNETYHVSKIFEAPLELFLYKKESLNKKLKKCLKKEKS